MVTVTITTADGKVYTDPSQIKVPRNENTRRFYEILDNYIPKAQPTGDDTA